jgi:hypothetical protein
MKMWTEAELIEIERSVCCSWYSDYTAYEVRNQVRQLIEIARYHGYVLPIPPMPPRNAELKPVPSVQPKPSNNPPPGWKKRKHS